MLKKKKIDCEIYKKITFTKEEMREVLKQAGYIIPEDACMSGIAYAKDVLLVYWTETCPED